MHNLSHLSDFVRDYYNNPWTDRADSMDADVLKL